MVDPEIDLVDELAERLRPFQLRIGPNTAESICRGMRDVYLNPSERRELAEQLAALIDELVERRAEQAGSEEPPVEDSCRPVRVVVDGQEETVRVRGREPMTDLDRETFAELVAATRAKVAAHDEHMGVRQELAMAWMKSAARIPDGPEKDRLRAAMKGAQAALTPPKTGGEEGGQDG